MGSTVLAGQNRKSIPVLLGFLLLSIASVAQELPIGKPESVGLSSERLERIGAAVQRSATTVNVEAQRTDATALSSQPHVELQCEGGWEWVAPLTPSITTLTAPTNRAATLHPGNVRSEPNSAQVKTHSRGRG